MPNADYEYKVNDGKVTLTRYLGKEELVTVPEEIDGYPVTTLDSTFLYKSTVRKIILPDSVTLLITAFYGCSGLEEIRLSDNLDTIYLWCFKDCYNLKKLKLPDSIRHVMRAVFEDSGIEEMYIPDTIEDIDELPPHFKVPDEPLIKGGNLLFVPRDTVEYTVPDNVKRIGVRAFADCKKLERVTISDTVQEICYEAFACCSSLKYVDLTDSLLKIDMGAFSDCTALEEITLPDSLKEINSYTFGRCTSLKKVNLPQNLENICSAAFSGCTVLESIDIPEGTKVEPSAFIMTLLDEAYRDRDNY